MPDETLTAEDPETTELRDKATSAVVLGWAIAVQSLNVRWPREAQSASSITFLCDLCVLCG